MARDYGSWIKRMPPPPDPPKKKKGAGATGETAPKDRYYGATPDTGMKSQYDKDKGTPYSTSNESNRWHRAYRRRNGKRVTVWSNSDTSTV